MLKITFKKKFVNLFEILQNFANYSLTKFHEFLREKRANFVKICAHEFLEGQIVFKYFQSIIGRFMIGICIPWLKPNQILQIICVLLLF